MALTVYFTSGVDLVNTDELTVRGQRYQIVVNGGISAAVWLRCCVPAGGLMSFSPVRLNRKEIGRILKEDYAEQVNKLAGRIADEARSLVDDDAVSVDEYTTDRAAASVSVPAERKRHWAC